MQIRHYGSYTVARTNLRDLLDAAHSGRLATVARDRERFAVVDADLLRQQLSRLRPSNAVVVAEGGGWSAFIPGTPIAGDGPELDDALTDLIDALRDYATDWNERLLEAPNHRDNWALVVLTELSDDTQLKDWILHDELSPAE